MRDCFFLVADKNMEGCFLGFLNRTSFHQSLGCAHFTFDPNEDLTVAALHKDPGLYTRGHDLLLPYKNTHCHAIVVLDAEWDGSPGPQTICQDMTEKIRRTGWPEDLFRVIVIDPELENWIWQKNIHVARVLGYTSEQDLMREMDDRGVWPAGQDKPNDPKETLESVMKKKNIKRSSANYRRITSKVSVRHCQDRAFQELRNTLRDWFPEGDR